MAVNFRPLNNHILVRPAERDTQTTTGLYLPETAAEKPQQGEVLAVGTGTRRDDGTRIPLDITAGDRVLFGKYSGTEIKLQGETYLILKEDDVLGIVVLDAQPA